MNESTKTEGFQYVDEQEGKDAIRRRHSRNRFLSPVMSTSTNMGNNETHYPRFRNTTCRCGLRAAVRISESNANPGRLYYGCPKEKEKGRCTYWEWCNPIGYHQPNPEVAPNEARAPNEERVQVIEVKVANLNVTMFLFALVIALIAYLK